MSGTNLVIAFDARIGNLEKNLDKITAAMKKTDDQAKKTQDTFKLFGVNLGGVMGSLDRITGGFGRLAVS